MKFMVVVLGSLAVWVLRRAERDYQARGTLSDSTAAAAWALYLLQTGMTVYAAWRPSSLLPANERGATVTGGVLALFGSILYSTSLVEFGSLRQVSGLEEGGLVTSGPYRFSRNPQNVGVGLTLTGISLSNRSTAALLLSAFFWIIFRLYLPIEELHLERTFGKDYRLYRSKTPRFLGLPE